MQLKSEDEQLIISKKFYFRKTTVNLKGYRVWVRSAEKPNLKEYKAKVFRCKYPATFTASTAAAAAMTKPAMNKSIIGSGLVRQ